MNYLMEAGLNPLSFYDEEWESWGTDMPYHEARAPEGDEAIYRLQADVRRVLDTGLGAVEKGRGAILFLLTRKEVEGPRLTHPVTDASWAWIRACLNLIDAKYGIDLGLPAFEPDFEFVLLSMAQDHLLATQPTRHGDNYSVTSIGTEHLSKAYLPVIEPLSLPA